MHPFPHNYSVRALAAPGGVVTVRGKDLADIQSTQPPEFDGPPGNWSPEALLVASVADCFVLTFRAIAAASKLEWLEIDCAANGVLEKTGEGLCFTRMELDVSLRVPQGANTERSQRLLEKAEKNCLVTNSLKTPVHLRTEVTQA